jgi:flagella basal body P-ring formation protein FlgA
MNTSVTEIYGRVVLTVFVVAAILAVGRAAFGAPAVATPAAAVEDAVQKRVGGGARVTVAGIETEVHAQPGLQALPDPGARTNQPVRFVLMKGRTRVGVAVATVIVSGPHAVAARAIARDEAVTDGDVAIVDGEWPSLPFTKLPAQDEVVGLKARRHIAAGEALTAAVLDVPPVVRSGDVVTVTATVGAVQVTGAGTASGSGQRGDIIRVTPRPNGRTLRARITGPAAVEVLQ